MGKHLVGIPAIDRQALFSGMSPLRTLRFVSSNETEIHHMVETAVTVATEAQVNQAGAECGISSPKRLE